MKMKLTVFVIIILINYVICNKEKICKQSGFRNQQFKTSILSNYLPIGYGSKKIKVLYSYKYTEMTQCIKACCTNKACDSVIFNNTICTLFHCKEMFNCQPVKDHQMFHNQYYFVFKNTNILKIPILKADEGDIEDNDDDDDEDDDTVEEGISTCELNVSETCGENQYCKELRNNRRGGICICNKGYIKKNHQCVLRPKSNSPMIKKSHSVSSNLTASTLSSSNRTELFGAAANLINLTTSISKHEMQNQNETNNVISTTSNSLGLRADAGPDLNIKVHKSSLFQHPEIVSVYGHAKIQNKILDLKNISYSWKRLPDSLAAGTIVNNSNYKQTLLLTNLIHGQYLFELTVHSGIGINVKDEVKITVTETEDENVLNFANIILTTNIYTFSEKEKNNFANRMAHIIEKDLSYSQCVVYIHSISPHYNNKTRITFYAKMFDSGNKFRIIPSGLLETKLRDKIVQHKYIFDYPVEKFESHFCYNDCSGHGACNQVSRRCECNLPWFNNGYREFKSGYSNCDMHIMTVVLSCVAGIFGLVLILAILKRLIKLIQRRSSYGKKVLQYRLLHDEAES